MSEETNQERAKAFAVRAYPSDSDFFKLECADKYENQQQAFKAFCRAYKTKGNTTAQATDTSELDAQKEALKLEIETIKTASQTIIDELISANKDLTLQVEELTEQASALKTPIKSPLNIELTQENATDLRKIRPFAIKKGIVTAEQYPERITNLAVKYLLQNEFSEYLK